MSAAGHDGRVIVRPPHALAGRWLWAVWLVLLLAWTVALLTPFPIRVKNDVLPQEAGFPVSKLAHFGGYAVLAGMVPWLAAGRASRWRLVALLSLHALGTELGQNVVPDRSGSWQDVAIDHAGLAAGLAVTYRRWAPKSPTPAD